MVCESEIKKYLKLKNGLSITDLALTHYKDYPTDQRCMEICRVLFELIAKDEVRVTKSNPPIAANLFYLK